MAAAGRPEGSSDIRILAALAASLAYAVLTLMPTAAGAPGSEPGDWLGALYPDVSGGWVRLRIALALAAAALLASGASLSFRAEGATAEPAPPNEPRSFAPAVALALAALALIGARSMNGIWPQTAWLALLYSPALVFLLVRRGLPAGGGRPGRLWLAAVPISLVWLVWRIAAAAEDGRQVDAVAFWGHLERLLALLGQPAGSQGVFAGGTWSDRSLILPLLQAGGLAEWTGVAPGLLWIAVVHALGTAAAALLVASSAGQVGGRAGAVAAATVLLFAPASLLAPLSPAPVFVGPLLVAMLAALAFRCARTEPSAASLAGLAATAGLATGLPQTLPTALLATVVLGSALYRARSVPGLTRLAVTVVLLAATIFGLPSSDEVLTRLKRSFGEGSQASAKTRVLLEQSVIHEPSPSLAEDAPRFAPFVGALLTPIATRRSPASLLGDTLLDPLGSVLALAGLGIAVRNLRRLRWARWLLAGLLAGLLPGAFGPAGATQPEMQLAATVPLSLLAALGLGPILGLFPEGRTRSAWLGLWLLGIASAGTVLFDVVNPRGLPASALGIGLEAARSGQARLTVLDHPAGKADFLHVAARTRLATAGRAAVRPLGSGDADWGQVVAELRSGDSVYLWSPALEADAGVTLRLCRLVPDLRLFALSDLTGQSRELAATAAGTSWKPGLPASRWSEGTCPPEAMAAEAGGASEPENAPDVPLPPAGPQKPERANLSRSDLMGALLGGQDLTGADIRGASLLGAKLRGANLNGARLRGSDLREADLSAANLNDADLRETDLTGATLEEASLAGANLRGVDLTATEMRGANLHRADLARANLEGLDLTSTNLQAADLAAANLRETSLGGMNLADANFARGDLSRAKLTGAELAGSELGRADLTEADLAGARLVDTRAPHANFAGAKLEQADLSGARLKRAAMDGTDLTGALLRGARLKRASLAGSDLRRADLSEVDLREANLAGAQLEGVVWSGSRCPDGTDSTANGGTCCGHHVGDPPASCSP